MCIRDSYKGAARLHAALCNASYYIGDFIRMYASRGYIIQEEQRLSALADYVVYAHSHGVYADSVVLVHKHGITQLSAHAVSPRNQHRLCLLYTS